MREKDAIGVLADIKEILDEHDIVFWLDQGTMLGAYRDKEFIPSDEDIDLGAWRIDASRIANTKEDFIKRGFTFDLSFDCLQLCRDGCYADIELIISEGGYFYIRQHMPDRLPSQIMNYMLWLLKMKDPNIRKDRISIETTQRLEKVVGCIPMFIRNNLISALETVYKKIDSIYVEKRTPVSYYEKLRTIDFYGMSVNVPGNTEEFLAEMYGDNWRRKSSKRGFSAEKFSVNKFIVKRHKYGEE